MADPSSAEDLLFLHNPSIQKVNLLHLRPNPQSQERLFLLNEPAGREAPYVGCVCKEVEGLKT